MTHLDLTTEITRFESVLHELDKQHRSNGHQYTPSEIAGLRKQLAVLRQLILAGAYDHPTNTNASGNNNIHAIGPENEARPVPRKCALFIDETW